MGKSQGLQCLGAWEEVNNDCDTKGWFQCSEPIMGTSDAICECINPCSQTGDSCGDTKCCGDGLIIASRRHSRPPCACQVAPLELMALAGNPSSIRLVRFARLGCGQMLR